VENVPDLIQTLANSGLTSRESLRQHGPQRHGCHLAGICNLEVFDVTPYADAVAKFFLRNP